MIKVATCQLPVLPDIDSNARHIETFLRRAAKEGAGAPDADSAERAIAKGVPDGRQNYGEKHLRFLFFF